MANVKDMYKNVINKAMTNAELIENAKDRAMAYAAIAQALAPLAVGQTEFQIDEKTVVEEKPDKKPAKKTADKMKRQPKELPPEDAPEDTPTEDTTPEPEVEEPAKEEKKETHPTFTEEWTDEAQAYFEKDLEYVEDFSERWTEDGLNQCIEAFSNGVIKDFEGINPLNIEGLVGYLKAAEEASDEDEE